MRDEPLLAARDLVKTFPVSRWGGRSRVHAVDGVSLHVDRGEVLGVVGESGCGKSTLGRLLLGLVTPERGTVFLEGQALATGTAALRQRWRAIQMVFQDSHASLNPRLTVERSLAFGPEVLGCSHGEARSRVHALLDRVGLDPRTFAKRYPHELSGGQRQRVNIARALAMRPRIVLFDEAVSALDKSVEAQVLNLLRDLREEDALTYVFISHDLNVVHYLSDRVLVMYLGKVVEIGPIADVYARPRHPYTEALVAALPRPEHRSLDRPPLEGDPPTPIDPPPGCRFRPRCPYADDVCAAVEPTIPPSALPLFHGAACHMADSSSGHRLAGSRA